MRIAITGGIGAGKSFVCRTLERRGIAIYDCDAAAKRLMRTSQALKDALTAIVGQDVYVGNTLQKLVLAKFLLANEHNNQAVNDIVHPAVAFDFVSSGMEWLESAILFESRFDRRVAFDHIICVTAPMETRVRRIMQRDHISRSQAMEWIERQFPEAVVAARCDFVIVNDGRSDLDTQIDELLNKINNTQ